MSMHLKHYGMATRAFSIHNITTYRTGHGEIENVIVTTEVLIQYRQSNETYTYIALSSYLAA